MSEQTASDSETGTAGERRHGAVTVPPTPASQDVREAFPVRVQLSRAAGWRMPPNTVKVDRTTRWGNPWPIGEAGPLGRTAPDAEGAVGFFEAMFRDREMREAAGYPEDLSPLAGKNLACWCRPGALCHADVLLARSNGMED